MSVQYPPLNVSRYWPSLAKIYTSFFSNFDRTHIEKSINFYNLHTNALRHLELSKSVATWRVHNVSKLLVNLNFSKQLAPPNLIFCPVTPVIPQYIFILFI